jgi:DNA-binding transcriptional ArsR family regulator
LTTPERFDILRIVTGEDKRRRRTVRKAFVVFDDADDGGGTVELEDTAAVQAVADPLRIRILRRLGEPASAKDLAADLERPVTSLYHHLDLLEQHGLIHVVDVTKEGRALVRRYQRQGNRFETAAQRVSSAVRDTKDADRRLRLVLRGPLDPSRLGELRRRVQSVVSEFVGDGDTTYEIVVTVSPTEEGDR